MTQKKSTNSRASTKSAPEQEEKQEEAVEPKTPERYDYFLQNQSRNDWTFALTEDVITEAMEPKVMAGEVVYVPTKTAVPVPGKIIHMPPRLPGRSLNAARVRLSQEARDELVANKAFMALVKEGTLSLRRVEAYDEEEA